MGAKTVSRAVNLVTAVGEGFRFLDVLYDFPQNTIKRVKGRCTEFFIDYDDDWNAHYREVHTGSGSSITTKDVLKAVGSGVDAVHLAPMNPPKVERIASAVKSLKRGVIVSFNPCIHYLNSKQNRDASLKAASCSDIVILNERELHAMTGKEVVSDALRTIKSGMLVLTLGEIGTIVSTRGSTEFIPAMSAITKKAVDVTGAGDTWSGSFLAAYLMTGSWIKAVSFASVISAIKCTGWNFEKVRPLRFESVEEIFDLAVAFKEKGRQLTLSDSLKTVRLP